MHGTDGSWVKEGLHWGLAVASLALMTPALVVVGHPDIEISLQFLDAAVDLLAEGDAVELVQHGAVEPLTFIPSSRLASFMSSSNTTVLAEVIEG